MLTVVDSSDRKRRFDSYSIQAKLLALETFVAWTSTLRRLCTPATIRKHRAEALSQVCVCVCVPLE